MTQYKIIYRDGRTREVPADKYRRDGDRYVFSSQGRNIFDIQAEVVESVGVADIPDAESPEVPEVGQSTAKRSGRVHGFD